MNVDLVMSPLQSWATIVAIAALTFIALTWLAGPFMRIAEQINILTDRHEARRAPAPRSEPVETQRVYDWARDGL